MAESSENKARGRKPANGIAAKSSAQRKRDQLARQETRINELPPAEWTKSDCLLVLQKKGLEGLIEYALIQLAELNGYSVTITKKD